MNYDFVMSFRFLNSANYYYGRRTKSDNSLELTDNFFGRHIGMDIGRDIYADRGLEIQLTGGIAIDGFNVLEEDKVNNLKSESTWSYNFNFGLGYRFYRQSCYHPIHHWKCEQFVQKQ
ncbi:MAG: hypothetical protein VB022_07970 [Rikenellaceae bacterium]|nr:hypothetical protein [Rikenellaceae bacterium]